MNINRPLFLLALLQTFLTPIAFGQGTDNDIDAYSENYRFTLNHVSAENKQSTLEFVVSAKNFKAASFEPRLDFSGTVLVADKGSLVLQYDLRLQKQVVAGVHQSGDGAAPFQTMMTVQVGLASNIRLKLGKAIEIWKADGETTSLIVTRVD